MGQNTTMVNQLNTDSLPPVQSNEFLPPISRWTRIGSLALVGAIAGAIALASAIEYKVTVKANASIRPVVELGLIEAPKEGQFNNTFVKANQAVKKGNLLTTIDDSQLQNNIKQTQLQLLQIDTRIKALKHQIQLEMERKNQIITSAQTPLNRYQNLAQSGASNTPLVIKAAVSPGDISKLQKGQRAQMRVSACPYPDYGTLNGVVSHISEDTIKVPRYNSVSTANNPNIPISGATNSFYEVTIIPDKSLLGKGKNQCTIQAGMQGRTDIISRKETVMKFMLRKARLIVNW